MLNKPLFVAVQSVLLCTATSSFQRNFVHKGDFGMKTKNASKANTTNGSIIECSGAPSSKPFNNAGLGDFLCLNTPLIFA